MEAFCENVEPVETGIQCLDQRNIRIRLKPPINAVKVAVTDGNSSVEPNFENIFFELESGHLWQTLPVADPTGEIYIDYYVKGRGVRNLRLFYQNPDGEILPYYAQELFVDQSRMDHGDFYVVDPMVDGTDIHKYIINDAWQKYDIYAVVNDPMIELEPRLPYYGESIDEVQLFVNDVPYGPKAAVGSRVYMQFPVQGDYFLQLKYTSIDGNVALETPIKRVRYKENIKIPEEVLCDDQNAHGSRTCLQGRSIELEIDFPEDCVNFFVTDIAPGEDFPTRQDIIDSSYKAYSHYYDYSFKQLGERDLLIFFIDEANNIQSFDKEEFFVDIEQFDTGDFAIEGESCAGGICQLNLTQGQNGESFVTLNPQLPRFFDLSQITVLVNNQLTHVTSSSLGNGITLDVTEILANHGSENLDISLSFLSDDELFQLQSAAKQYSLLLTQIQ